MKKIRKPVIAVVSLIISTMLMMLVGCSCVLGKIFAEGDFIYRKATNSDEVAIIGLTDSGLQKEILVAPTTVRGYRVGAIGASRIDRKEIKRKYGSENIMFNSKKLKRIYIPTEIRAKASLWGSVSGGDANCVIIVMGIEKRYMHYFEKDSIKVSAKCFYENTDYYRGEGIKYWNPDNVMPANVGFYYNYTDSPNDGLYWVDDYDGELISYVPKNPVRSGYTFAGWYKEPECINEWDFETDIVPAKEYGVGVYHFKELTLYAKWI